jgi:hypothetical protein
MTTSHIRLSLSSVVAGLLATTAIALVPSLAAAPADAGDDKQSCAKPSPGGSSDKKCPSPTPSPTSSAPQGNETGCRDVTLGVGQFRGLEPVPSIGSVLEFTLVVDGQDGEQSPTCPEVTYSIIARDQDTLAEVARLDQAGNGITPTLSAVFQLPTYSKACIAVDVVVAEGNVIHDIAPDSRDPLKPQKDLCRDGSGPQTWN